MADAISKEFLKLEMESSSKRAEMKEIKSVLLEKGEIQRFWNEKLDEERARGSKVEELYFFVVQDLEQERIVHEKCAAEFLKEKAAMDCQMQLVSSPKEEVAEMSERLASERTMYVTERNKLLDMPSDLQSKLDGILDTKSIREAEIEAIKILKSWVEDEARKSQARVKVLEEVGEDGNGMTKLDSQSYIRHYCLKMLNIGRLNKKLQGHEVNSGGDNK